ncbi:MAG: helix-turn-helix domain-containing protein [Desulfobacterales bacterium]|nr:helix-turn-helix domain-containing protein [Desulfobacterales bacterium]
MIGNINCPNEHGEMTLEAAQKEIFFKGEKITYQTESYVCKECGINIGTIEQGAAIQTAIADAYRKKVGLLGGEEIKQKRAERRWTQKDLAEKSGVGIASIKRWENGIIQTRSVNEALKNAFQDNRVGNIYTGNRDRISLSRLKLVFKCFEAVLGFGFLNEGDMLLFDAKYSWYADMLAFRELGMGITGADYAALPHGPQINNYKELVKFIREANEFDAKPLTEEEIRIITRVAKTFPTKPQVIDAAHREIVWRRKGPGENIPYSDADELTEI